MRDFLPADVRKRNYVINIIREVYESYGFEPLETPAVENLDTLMGKYGEEGNQLIFKILKRGEKLRQETGAERQESDVSGLLSSVSGLADLALRYDLTVPLARVVANHRNDLPKFFKRYQIQPVWRADRPARGRFREFYQCDVDAIGSESVAVDCELISAVTTVLVRLGFTDFKIRVNHRRELTDILNYLGVSPEKHEIALVSIDKMDKIGLSGVIEELESKQISKDSCLMLSDFFGTFFERDRTSENRNEVIHHLISGGDLSVETYFQKLIAYSQNDYIEPDPTLARGLSYYTGGIFEIVLTDGDFKGSIGGGGRYDGLIGMFGKEQIPACGFSLGLERILVVMDERGMFPPEIAASTPADVMVTVWSEETLAESLRLANELRQNGLRVTLYPDADKLGKQMKYADQIKVPWVCVLGENEITEGKVTIKNMQTGEQQSVDRKDAFNFLLSSSEG